MTESRKYRVPDEAVKYVGRAIDEARGGAWGDKPLSIKETKHIVLEAFIRWQSENPPMLTMEAAESMRDNGHPCILDGVWYAMEWVRRMYLAPPEPEFGGVVQGVIRSTRGCTFTREEANAMIDRINECVAPETEEPAPDPRAGKVLDILFQHSVSNPHKAAASILAALDEEAG